MSDLAEKIRDAIAQDHVCEVILRVSRYEALSGRIGEPAAWQCIVKYQDAQKGPWGVGIRKCPIAALEAALAHKTISGDKRPEDIFA